MTDTKADALEPHAHGGNDWVGYAHVMSLPMLIGVFVTLLGLTWITVEVTHYNLGSLNLWIAMGIATVKAALVALYFMHLRYDKPFNMLVLAIALLWVFLFICLTMVDAVGYQPLIQQYRMDNPPQAAG